MVSIEKKERFMYNEKGGNMKKIITVISILIIIVSLTGCGKTKKTDALKFREEYMSLNGEKNDYGKKNRSITIPKENPFIYQTAEELVERIEKKESFLVYFGFAKCPWCRSVLEELIKALDDNDIDKIYYVDVLDIRDIKEIDEEGNIKTTKEATEGYKRLIKQLDEVLEEYTLTKDEETISAGEKRIYAPNVVSISNGKPIQLETGISEKLKDPYDKLTSEIKKYAYNTFNCQIKCLKEKSTTCQKNSC